MAREYRVVWEIDITAEGAYKAAVQALAIQRDPASIATVFVVSDPSGGAVWRTFDLPNPAPGDEVPS